MQTRQRRLQAATVSSFLCIWKSSVKFSPVQSGDDLRAFGVGIEQQRLPLSQESKGGLAGVSQSKFNLDIWVLGLKENPTPTIWRDSKVICGF